MLTLLDAPWFGGETYVWPAAPARYLSDDAGELEMPAPTSILLDGHQYAIETREYRHSSRRTLRDSTAVAGEPSDSLFDAGGAWMRYRHSWHLGGGQALDDLGGEQANPFRFLFGIGVDPWTQGQLTRAPSWQDLPDGFSASDGVESSGAVANGWVAIGDGAQVKVAQRPFTAWTNVTGLAGVITSMSSDGVDFYIGTSSNLYRLAAGDTAASVLSAGNVDHVAFVHPL